ncbi:MAG: DnaJ domain-containing protein [Desulfobacterales bacterium]|nr:DnaJ domain-containing protein [Desulfobacterales bacterium]
MDKTRALQILGLGSSANRSEAKSAFRELAKKFHPDRFARDPKGAAAAEVKMKEINAAFHFISPILPSGPSNPVRPDPQPKKKRSGLFSSFSTGWMKRKKQVTRSKPGTRAGAPKTASGKVATPKSRAFDPPHRKNRPKFDTLLRGLGAGPKPRVSVVQRRNQSVPLYENYHKYMTMKKKIQSARNRSKNMGVGRVEKVSPVQKVSGIGG